MAQACRNESDLSSTFLEPVFDTCEQIAEDQVEESEDVYFDPVVTMPDEVQVETGEENEQILCIQRAKLFRFDANKKEWAERGEGEIKILRHNETGKVRLVMRREATLKLCLNHFINLDFQLDFKDEKSLLWGAADYSSDKVTYSQFACRFKSLEIAQDFKELLENSIKSDTIERVSQNSSNKNLTVEDNQEDLSIVYEARVSDRERLAALKLELPKNFYAYKLKLEKCPGCIGCEDSDSSFEDASSEGQIVDHDKLVQGHSIKTSDNESSSNSHKEAESSFSNLYNWGSRIVSYFSNRIFGDVAQDEMVTFSDIASKNEQYSRLQQDFEHGEIPKQDTSLKPVVSMAEEVQLLTGEEDERKIFGERGKFYVFDVKAKEWKERGIGEMKILQHTTRGTYRLLLRREQVYKIVCNVPLTKDMEFSELNDSKNRTWMWAGMNFAYEKPLIENVAIKLKTPEQANRFRNVVRKAQQALRQ